MAEGTGITSNAPQQHSGSSAKSGGSFFKKNKPLVIGGGILGVILLMSRKGATGAAAGDPNAQLQATSDALAAQQSAAAIDASAGANVAAGDGSGSSDGSGFVDTPAPAPTATAGPIIVNVNEPPPTPSAQLPPAPAPVPHAPAAGPVAGPANPGDNKPAAAIAPKAAAREGKPNAADNKPNAHGTPFHPDSPKKTGSGAKKKSPANVESVHGRGSGVVVLGREFPGAQGHRMGPPMRDVRGGIQRTVTVDYGGRTETHIAHVDRGLWTDNIAGMNPPSRGVPTMNEGHPR